MLSNATFKIHRGRMICSQAEAVERTYRVLVGKGGNLWLVARQPNEADHIYASDSREGSDGFAGAVLEFDIGGGNSVKLQGGWKSNASKLFKETGYDARDKFLTRVVVGTGREGSWNDESITGVLYHEEDWVLGEYGRGTEIAQRLADERGCKVYVYDESQGGSMSKWVWPTTEEAPDA